MPANVARTTPTSDGRPEGGPVDLSVVIPCYDEVDRLPPLPAALAALLQSLPEARVQLVLVDDGSTDGTREVMRRLATSLEAAHPGRLEVEVVGYDVNRGKGGALRAGVGASSGRWVLTADVDMATPLAQVGEWQRAGAADVTAASKSPVVLVGSREHAESVVEDAPARRLIGRIFNVFVQLVSGLPLRDTQCGFKLYPGELARRIFGVQRESGWGHDVELLLLARACGAEIRPLPVRWRAVEASKVRPSRDAGRMLVALVRCRLSVFWRARLGVGTPRLDVEAVVEARPWERASVVLLGTILLLILVTVRHYGITWDESLHWRYGRLVIDYYAGLLRGVPDRSALHFADLALYGGLFDVISDLAARVAPSMEVVARHLVNALAGFVGIVGAWRLARLVGGARAGAFAVAALALTPTYYGHMFANPKDIPFAAAYVWGVYALLRAAPRLPGSGAGDRIRLAVLLGAALAIRAGGLLLFAYLGALLAATVVVSAWLERRRVASEIAAAIETGGWVTVGAGAITMAFWPAAFEEPLRTPFATLEALSRFPRVIELTYRGELLPNQPMPTDYVPRLFAIQLPEPLLVLLMIAILAAVTRVSATLRAAVTGRDAAAARAAIRCGLLVGAAVAPAAHVVWSRAPLYDALRHLTFLLPLFAVLAAVAFDGILDRLGDRSRRAALALVLAWAGGHTLDVARLHPYEYVYYNRLVGGVSGAAGRYELDYWAASYREATLRLMERLRAEAAATGRTEPYRVFVDGPKEPASRYFAPVAVRVGGTMTAEFALVVTRAGLDRRYDAPELLRVERRGVALTRVFDLRPAQLPRPGGLAARTSIGGRGESVVGLATGSCETNARSEEATMRAHRQRRATPQASATPCRPKGYGDSGASAAFYESDCQGQAPPPRIARVVCPWRSAPTRSGARMVGASGCAGFAASLLTDRHPDLERATTATRCARGGTTCTSGSRSWLPRSPQGSRPFSSRGYSGPLLHFRAGQADVADLESSLECLRDVQRDRLPGSAVDLADGRRVDEHASGSRASRHRERSRARRGAAAGRRRRPGIG